MNATTRRPDSRGTSDAEQSIRTTQRTLTKDQIYHVLQVSRRRDVLAYLEGTAGPVRMRDVAEQVAAWEHDTTLQALTSKQRQRVYISLYQTHLPTLDREGIIDYQQSRGVVERTPVADQFTPYLTERGDATPPEEPAVTRVDERPWPVYYLGVSGLGSLLLAGSTLGLPVVSRPSSVAVVSLILAVFAALTVGQLLDDGGRSFGR